MGRKKLKHLGKNKKIRIQKHIKQIGISIGILISIISIFSITKYIGNKENEYSNKQAIILDEEKKEFIKSIEEGSKKSYKKYGIYSSITIAQAILESGWGQSKLATESNNIFGIKADSSWNGAFIEVMTSENYNDKIKAKFRQYDDISESIEDHAKFLVENPRYEKHGVFKAKNYKEQAQALEDAGYSTKKNKHGELIYADMLVDLIEKYDLHKADK